MPLLRAAFAAGLETCFHCTAVNLAVRIGNKRKLLPDRLLSSTRPSLLAGIWAELRAAMGGRAAVSATVGETGKGLGQGVARQCTMTHSHSSYHVVCCSWLSRGSSEEAEATAVDRRRPEVRAPAA